MKTPEEILKKHFDIMVERYPNEKWHTWDEAMQLPEHTAILNAMGEYASQLKPEMPMDETINNQFPINRNVVMEEGASYYEVTQRNYYRREGAKWMRDLISKEIEK